MSHISDPVSQWILSILVSVLAGTCLLIVVASSRRWRQMRYARYVHILQRQYRPVLARLLASGPNPSGIAALRELSRDELEVLLDPLFARRKITERSMVFLHGLCAELGLIEAWESRVADDQSPAAQSSGSGVHQHPHDRTGARHLARAKSVRNLGTLRHRSSWPLLACALDDRHLDIRLAALRALAAMGVADSFPVLRDRLQAVAQGKSVALSMRGLQAAMVAFDLRCLPALLPILRHTDRRVRLRATEILWAMVLREAARQPRVALSQEILSPPIVELLLTELAVDTSAAIRARAAELIVVLADPRTTSVLRNLLLDRQWLVRLYAVHALAHFRQTVSSLHPYMRECLRDPHWRVREAATKTLISLGQEGKEQLFEHFLASRDHPTRQQIIEVIERTGLMSSLVEEYGAGVNGLKALMVEQLASDAASLGLSGVLRTSSPEVRQKFLDRILPQVEAKLRFLEETQPDVESPAIPQQAREFPPRLAA